MASGNSGYGMDVNREKDNAMMEQRYSCDSPGTIAGTGDCQTGKQEFIGVWKKFCLIVIFVTKESRGKKEELKNLNSLSPIKMQFLLKHRFDDLQKIVSAENYQLKQSCEGLRVVVSDPESKVTTQVVVGKLVELLLPLEEDIAIRDLSDQGKQYFDSVMKIIDNLIKLEKVDLFLSGGTNTVLVGKKDHVKEALDMINSVNNQNTAGENIRKLDCPEYEGVLKKLAVEEDLNQKWGNLISIKIDQGKVFIKGDKTEKRDQVEGEIFKIISNLVVIQEDLGDHKGRLLEEDMVKEYIYEKMSHENILCYICTSNDSRLIKIYTKTKDMQVKAVDFLKKVIGELSVPGTLVDTEDFRKFHKLHNKKMLIPEMQQKLEDYLIIATDDVLLEIRKMLQKVKKVSMEMQQSESEMFLPQNQMEILCIFEKSFRDFFQQRCQDISYKIDPKKRSIIFHSDKNKCTEGQKCMSALFDENAYSSKAICSSLIVEFFNHAAVIDHVNKQLQKLDIDCMWKVDNNGYLHTFAESNDVCDKAMQRIQSSVIQTKLSHYLKTYIDTSVELGKKMQHYGKKAQIFENTNTELVLVATDDICPAILEELKNLKQISDTNPKKFEKGYTKVMVGKKRVQYIYCTMKREIEKLESEYNVKISQSSDSKSLIVKGTQEKRISAVKILKSELSDRIKVSTVSLHVDPSEKTSVKKKISTLGYSDCQIEEDFCESEIKFHKCWIDQKSHRRLIQVLGHVADIETEAMFCPTNQSFFPLGEGLNIYLKGGKTILGQMIAEHTVNIMSKDGMFKENLANSAFISTETGCLPCRYLVCGVVSRQASSSDQEMQISKCMQDVFRLCEDKGCKTLALSVEGFDDFQCDRFTHKIVHAVVENFTKSKELMEIYLCRNNDSFNREVERQLRILMAGFGYMEIDFSRIFPFSRCFMDRSDPENVQNIAIELDTNGLGGLEVDMVVNTASTTLDLTKGALSKSLLEAGGHSIQDECKEKYSKGIHFGQAVTTESGNLKCQKLCHGALGLWCFNGFFSLNLLKLLIINCLSEAEKLRYATVGFPPLGTGKLKYPHQLVASVMYDCVQEYGWRNPETGIEKVIFALHPTDYEVIKVFRAVVKGKDQVRTIEEGNRPQKKILSTWINSRGQNVHIRVMPSQCVRMYTEAIVFFDQSKKSFLDGHSDKTQDVADWKETGQLEIHLHKTEIDACLEILENKRICSVEVTISGMYNQEVKNLVKDIKKALYLYGTQKGIKYLSQMYIVLSGPYAFKDFLDHEIKKRDKIKGDKTKRTFSFFTKTEKDKPPKWQVVCFAEEPEERDIEFFVIGSDQNQVDECRDQIQKLFSQTTTEGYVEEVLQEKTYEMVEPSSPSIQRDVVGIEDNQFNSSASHSSTSERSVIKKPDILKKIKADVNPAFLELDYKVLEKIQGEIKSKWNVELVLDKEKRSMKLEGCNFEDVKKVNSYLENKVEEMNKSENKRTDSIGSDFTGVDILKITPREFDTLMYFWGNEYMRAHKDVKISYGDDQEVFVQFDQTESENLKMEINREIEKIRKMTDTETIFEKSQIEKAKSCLQTLQSEFKEVYFFLDEDKLILHAVGDYNYTLKQTLSHRAKLLTGQIKETKRGRRFAAGEDISVGQNDGHPGQDEYRSMPSSLPSRDSMRSSTRGQNRSTDEKKKFTTKEGIDIYVYSESILQLDVDCIVNAANERLGHGAGVAAVIASAAGYELEQEGKEYIERYGPIPVGKCCHTTAGRLPYRYVIHTVGPRWNNSMTFEEQKQCKKELQSAIESCFYKADFLRMKSVGVPSVSAGIFGMPPYICAKQYLEAVLNYSQQRTWSSNPTTLKEIHFIDMNIEMCKQIADVFSQSGDLLETGISVGSKPSNISTSSRHSFSQSLSSRSLSNSSFDRYEDEAYSSSVEKVFYPCKWVTIHLLQSSIIDVKKVSAVVSPENLGFKHQGRISKAILDKADEDFKENVEIMKGRPTFITNVFPVNCSEKMQWEYVLYTIAPRWDSKYEHNIQQFETDLKDTVVNILSEVEMKRVKSLAIPLLGTAVSLMKTPMESCCRSMLDGILSIINRGTRKKNWELDLWIVTTDEAAIHTFEKMLNTRTGSKLTDTNPDLGSSKLENQKKDDKTLDEDCCICMDKITDPKWLPCKHVFCTDCIDQQFKFKPACPQCGAVHGIVTGDQPPGSMSRKKQYFSLPGYPECKTIAITYTFLSGYQSEEHPNPGQPYTGITRTGYLPDNEKGRLVAKLLQVAFDRRLVFTIGRSRTTGQEGVITWNDIHHKTRTYGGQQSFGYPDDTYLDRVLDELAAKGVTKDSINE